MKINTTSESQTHNTAPLLTREQVAQRLNLCKHTVARYEARGLITSIKISPRVVRYSEAQVNALLLGAK